jgi:hypothetical protein
MVNVALNAGPHPRSVARYFVSIHRQSRWLYGCWPLKGAFSQPSEAKARTKAKPRTAVFTAAAQATRGRTYSRNSQSSTATPAEPSAEPGDLPFGLATVVSTNRPQLAIGDRFRPFDSTLSGSSQSCASESITMAMKPPLLARKTRNASQGVSSPIDESRAFPGPAGTTRRPT